MLARHPMPEMTFEDYLEWEAKQDERWEFVCGRPVRRSDRQDYDPATGVAGASKTHRGIQSNLMFALTLRLRDGPFWASANDAKTTSRDRHARYPDIVVECGPKTGPSILADDPRVVLEIMSKSNSFLDQLRLLDDYQASPSLQQVIFVEQLKPQVLSWTRHELFWPREDLLGLDKILRIPVLNVKISLSEIYDGVEFEDADAE
jgi:Uma2 family endonuclease